MKRTLLTLTVLALTAVSLAAALPSGAATNRSCNTSGRFLGNGTVLRYKLRCSFPVERLTMRSSAPLERVGAVRTREGDHLRCGKRPHALMSCRGSLSSHASIKQELRLDRAQCTAVKLRFRVSGPDVEGFQVGLRKPAGCNRGTG